VVGTYQNAPCLGAFEEAGKLDPAGLARPSLTLGCSSPPSHRSGGSEHTSNMMRPIKSNRETGSTSWFRDYHEFDGGACVIAPSGREFFRQLVIKAPSGPEFGEVHVDAIAFGDTDDGWFAVPS
jgi:hypothetical protein